MRLITYAFWILVVLIGASFAVINSHTVTIHYYVGSINVYVPLLLLVELAIGALLGIVAMMPKHIKVKNSARKSRQRIKKLEQEVKSLQEALSPTEGFQ